MLKVNFISYRQKGSRIERDDKSCSILQMNALMLFVLELISTGWPMCFAHNRQSPHILRSAQSPTFIITQSSSRRKLAPSGSVGAQIQYGDGLLSPLHSNVISVSKSLQSIQTCVSPFSAMIPVAKVFAF